MSENDESANIMPAEQDASQGEVQQTQNQSSENKSSKMQKFKDTAKKLLKKGAGKQSLLAVLGPILLWIFVGIVILIIIIGLAMFLVTMPGMAMEQLKALFKEAGNFIAAFFGADTTKQIESKEVYGTLDYLEQMGYDLKGEGFLTKYLTSEADLNDETDKSNGVHVDEKVGVIRDDDDKIIGAESDFIFAYIVSDNYVYTIKNGNIVTKNEGDNWFENFISSALTAIYKYYNAIYGPIFDALGITDATIDQWGSGLLMFYYDKGVGIRGDPVNTENIWNWDDIKVDIESKKLLIKRNNILNNNNAMEFSLDGWTGRYGMPLEFLLSVHKATQMPDLAYDMATSFNTNVNIYLHKIEGEARTAYKNGSKYVTYEEVEKALSGVSGRNLISSTFAWADDLVITDEEASGALKAGLPHAPGCTCNLDDVKYSYAGMPVINKDGKYFWIDSSSGAMIEINEESVIKTQVVCSECKDYIKRILKLLRKDNDYNFKAYMPYIASVKDHWYRDVYFVVENTNLNFVDYDHEYEALMKERWTLYETYTNNPKDGYKYNPDKEGEYILYAVDKDGKLDSKPYEGTEEEARNKGIKLSKKAETIKASDEDTMTDLGWKKPDNVWMAYKVDNNPGATDYEEAYPNIKEDESDYEIKKKIYVQVDTVGNIIQTGEGQRTTTNPEIKKMFLQNRYFRYDGSAETAEIITKLRNENEIAYGPLSENDLNKKVEIEKDGKNKTCKVSEYSGNVTLNQDSLNAFSMLENTHTLDADYIYRDFKELIVELGYFTKEELTDETPRLLQWLVPDIGSGGYPKRVIDKRENEFGTMIHSKGDIDANEKYTLAAIVDKIRNAKSKEIITRPAPDPGGNHFTPSGMIGVNSTDMNSVGAIDTGAERRPEEVSVEEFLTAAEEVHKVIEDLQFQYCWGVGQTHNSDMPHTDGHGCAGLFNTLEEASGTGGRRIDCSTYVSYVLQAVGLMKGRTYTGSPDGSDGFYGLFKDYIITREEAGELKPGDMLLSDKHIQINGENHIQYNAGKGEYIRSAPYEEASPSFYTHVIRLPFNGSSTSESAYEGYEGNEAVVSPVTGILLEYGTYQDGEKDGVSQEEYRTNVDLKYGPANTQMIDEEGNAIPVEDLPEDREGGEIVADKVGYAKILVLDAEHYQKLEAGTGNRWKNSGDNLVKINQKRKPGEEIQAGTKHNSPVRYVDRLNTKDQMDEKNEDWSAVDKTVYGYKEFAESYEKAGIAGHIVYIDGFVCEEPDEKLAGGEDTKIKMAEQLPEGDRLTLDSFKVKESELEEQAKSEDALQSLYEMDEEFKVASKKTTDKLNAEISVKGQACTAITINDSEEGDLVFIKEGTVIGRTMTDKELVTKIRKDPPHDYEYYRPDTSKDPKQPANPGKPGKPEEENQDKVMGNYIRIIMRDLDDTVVENVEDYMKLDVGEKKNTLGEIEQFMYWQAKEPEGFEYVLNGQKSHALAESNGKSRSDNPSDKYGHNYHVDDGGAGDKNLCPGIFVGGGSGQAIFTEVTGDSNIQMIESKCTGEQLLDIYTKELEANMEIIKTQYPTTADWEEGDTRLFALMDVMYAGEGNFKLGTIDDVLLAGGTLTKEDFLSNCTSENAFYTQNKSGFTRRRLCDWYMYSEGKFGHNIYDTKDTSDIAERWEFISETPFQDLMVDKEGAELVPMH